MYYPSQLARHFNVVVLACFCVLTHIVIVNAQKDTNLTPTSVETIFVPVSVIDKHTNHIFGLTKENFTILVNGKPQEIVFFNGQKEASSICFIYDTSGSVAAWGDSKLTAVANEIPSRLAQQGHASNEYFLFTFNEQTNILLDGVSKEKILERMRKPLNVTPSGNTAMNNALSVAIDKLSRAKNKNRAIVLIADGYDNASRLKLSELNKQIGASGIPIYILDMQYTPTGQNPFAYIDFAAGRNLAKLSGGQLFDSSDFFYFEDKNFKIREEKILFLLNDIQSRYTIGFKSVPSKDEWRRVNVKVNLPPDKAKEQKHISVRSREKYYADTKSQ